MINDHPLFLVQGAIRFPRHGILAKFAEDLKYFTFTHYHYNIPMFEQRNTTFEFRKYLKNKSNLYSKWPLFVHF